MVKSITRKSAPQNIQLLETTLGAPSNVDREAGVIRGVKILGRTSKNGREYTDSALREAAELYEGIGVMFAHPPKGTPNLERHFAEKFGELRDCKPGQDGVYGDLHYLKSHALAESVCESAERFPKQFGLSHNAQGREIMRGGKRFVESVVSVRSVDIVTRPATNSGLFESEQPMAKTIREITESLKKNHPRRGLLLEMMDAEFGDAAVADMPVEVPAEASADEQAEMAIETVVLAVMRDDSLDNKAKLARLAEILDAKDMLKGEASASGGGEGGGEVEKKEPEGSMSESEDDKKKTAGKNTDPRVTKLLEEVTDLKKTVGSLSGENAELKLDKHVRGLLESANREVTDVRVKSLKALKEDKERKELIETWDEMPDPALDTTRRTRPASSPSALVESEQGYPKDRKSFVGSVKKGGMVRSV